MILDDVYKDNSEGGQLLRFQSLLEALGIPEEVSGIGISTAYTWETYQKKLIERYGDSPTTNDT